MPSSRPDASRDSEHLPAVDQLKGIAILWVICIHAKLGEGTVAFDHLVNRAVPIFLVLFGLTSERWWTRRTQSPGVTPTGQWLGGRLSRLVPPFWGMAALWWLVVWNGGQAPLPVDGLDVFLTFAGYAPWIGTSWFVTLILQLVLLFPLLRRAVDALPPWLLLTGTGLLSSWCVWHTWTVVAWGKALLGDNVAEPGWYYLWIFSPRVLFHVVAGMLVARLLGGRPSARLTGLCLALVATGPFVLGHLQTLPDAMYVGPLRAQVIVYLLDVPLAVGLLGLLQHLRLPGVLGAPLALLALSGRWSWGLYLGHLWVHEALHLGGIEFEAGPGRVRAQYAVVLLAFGAIVAALGAAARVLAGAATQRLGKVLATPAAGS